MKERYRRSKRVLSIKNLGVSFLLTGVFLVGLVSFPTKAHAAELNLMSPQLNDNAIQLMQLKTEAERREQKLDAIMPQVEQLQKETEAVDAAKAELKAATSDLEKEIAELKVKLAEKRRIEALRIVTVSGYAPDSEGNTYAAGNCTWYAKSRRPDLPNSLGNANTWYYRAIAQGFKGGSQAKKNAIGVSTAGWLGHVVYVEAWYKDGTILISEMNYQGLYSMNTRIANESDFMYIYEMR